MKAKFIVRDSRFERVACLMDPEDEIDQDTMDLLYYDEPDNDENDQLFTELRTRALI